MAIETAPRPPVAPTDLHEEGAAPEPRPRTAGEALRRSTLWWVRTAAILASILAAYEVAVVLGGFVTAVLTVMLYLVFGAVISFIVSPIVDGLERWARIPRTAAILLALLGVLGVLVLLVYLAAGPTVTEAQQLAAKVPEFVSRANSEIQHIQRELSDRGINVNNVDFGSYLQSASSNLSSILISGVTGTVSAVVDVVIVLVVAFWLLKDGEKLRRGALDLVPAGLRVNAEFAVDSIGVVIGGYVRAQLVLAIIIGTLAGVGCAVIGVPFPIVVAITAGMFELIPIVGPFAGGAVAVLLALTVSLSLAVGTVILFIGIHIVEGYVLAPRIQARFVRLHPLVSLLALFAGIEVRGFLGAFFAVPIASLVAVYMRAFIGDVRARRPELYATAGADTNAERRRTAILGEFRFFKRSPAALVRAWLRRGGGGAGGQPAAPAEAEGEPGETGGGPIEDGEQRSG
ncbi:MAG TPA: AI-2E family transporter [Candidatus Dormibacteraeota bacterium]|nr:AI-2E family transporter [Candidatus Dormibacteraeota bacterium]